MEDHPHDDHYVDDSQRADVRRKVGGPAGLKKILGKVMADSDLIDQGQRPEPESPFGSEPVFTLDDDLIDESGESVPASSDRSPPKA
jgi:hypothetical protein